VKLIDVKHLKWLETREAQSLYAPCAYCLSAEKYAAYVQNWRERNEISVFACLNEGEYAGIIVLETQKDCAEILGIAVKSELRGRGVGAYMIAACTEELRVRTVTAETDDDGVEFYRRTGFCAQRFVKHFADGDVVRYRCEKRL